MTDPTMPEVPPMEVLWGLCSDLMNVDRCHRCYGACQGIVFAKGAYSAVRAELVRQQEKNRE